MADTQASALSTYSPFRPRLSDTQNETARSLTPSDRAAVRKRVNKLAADLREARTDLSTLASRQTCLDLSKLLPSSLSHDDERQDALDVYNAVFINALAVLHTCYVTVPRDDASLASSMPAWLFEDSKAATGLAMEVLLCHVAFGLMAFLDQLHMARQISKDRSTSPNAAASLKEKLRKQVENVAALAIPLFRRFLLEDERATPRVRREVLEVVFGLIEEHPPVSEIFFLTKAGAQSLAKVFSLSRDQQCVFLALEIARTGLRKANLLKINAFSTKLFPLESYALDAPDAIRAAFLAFVQADSSQKDIKRQDVFQALSNSSPHHAHVFLASRKTFAINDQGFNFANKGAGSGRYEMWLNERSLTTSVEIGNEVRLLEIALDKLTGLSTDNQKDSVCFVMSCGPSLAPELEDFTRIYQGETRVSIRIEPAEIVRLKGALKSRYLPKLISSLGVPKAVTRKPGKASLSQQLPSQSRGSQSSEDRPEKKKQREEEILKTVRSSEPDRSLDDQEEPVDSKLPDVHARGYGTLSKSKGLSISDRNGENTRMSLPESPGNDDDDDAGTTLPSKEKNRQVRDDDPEYRADEDMPDQTKPAGGRKNALESMSAAKQTASETDSDSSRQGAENGMERAIVTEQQVSVKTLSLDNGPSKERFFDAKTKVTKSIKQKDQSDNDRKSRDLDSDDASPSKISRSKEASTTANVRNDADVDYDDLPQSEDVDANLKAKPASKGKRTGNAAKPRSKVASKESGPASKRSAQKARSDSTDFEITSTKKGKKDEHASRDSEKVPLRSSRRPKKAVDYTLAGPAIEEEEDVASIQEDVRLEVAEVSKRAKPIKKAAKASAPWDDEVSDFFDRTKANNLSKGKNIGDKQTDAGHKRDDSTTQQGKHGAETAKRDDHTAYETSAQNAAAAIEEAFEDLMASANNSAEAFNTTIDDEEEYGGGPDPLTMFTTLFDDQAGQEKKNLKAEAAVEAKGNIHRDGAAMKTIKSHPAVSVVPSSPLSELSIPVVESSVRTRRQISVSARSASAMEDRDTSPQSPADLRNIAGSVADHAHLQPVEQSALKMAAVSVNTSGGSRGPMREPSKRGDVEREPLEDLVQKPARDVSMTGAEEIRLPDSVEKALEHAAGDALRVSNKFRLQDAPPVTAIESRAHTVERLRDDTTTADEVMPFKKPEPPKHEARVYHEGAQQTWDESRGASVNLRTSDLSKDASLPSDTHEKLARLPRWLTSKHEANSAPSAPPKPKQVTTQKRAVPFVPNVEAPQTYHAPSNGPAYAPDDESLASYSIQLARLITEHHRKTLGAYKSSKLTGVDSIVDIVAAGCREAQRMDAEFLQSLRERNEELHRAHAESLVPLQKLEELVKKAHTKTGHEQALMAERKQVLQRKLRPDLFSNFKSLQQIKSR